MMEARNIRETLIRDIRSSSYVEVTEEPDALILSMDGETVYYEKGTGLLSFGEGKAAKPAVRDMRVWKEKETLWFELIFECLEEGSYEVRGAACPRNGGGR